MKCFLTFFFLFLTLCLNAQLKDHAQTVGINFGAGTLVPHKPSMNHLVGQPAYKMEIDYTFRTRGSKAFQASYNYPYFGMVYAFETSGNPMLIGNLHSLNIFGALPFYKGSNPLRIRFGIGMGYVQKPFNIEDNHKNNAIGSRFNTNIQMRIEKNFSLGDKQIIRLGLGASHFSNASFQKPNLGLNYAHLYIGYGLQTNQPGIITEDRKLGELNRKLQYKIIVGSGMRENDPGLGKKRFIVALTAQVEKNLSHKSSIFLSSDNYLNYSLREINGKSFQSGLTLGYMQHFNNLRVGLGLGAHIHNKPSANQGIYNKVIIEYHFSHRFFAQLLLRSHSTTADFFNVTLGFNIK